MNRPSNTISKTKHETQMRLVIEETRRHWETILLMVMHKNNIKSVIIDDDDLKSLEKAAFPDGNAFLISKSRTHIVGGKFALYIAYNMEEREKLIAQHE